MVVALLRLGGIPVSLTATTGCLYLYFVRIHATYVEMREACVSRVAELKKVLSPQSRNVVREFYFATYVYNPPFFREGIVLNGPRDPAVELKTREWLALNDHAMFVFPLIVWTAAGAVEAWVGYFQYRKATEAEIAKHFTKSSFLFRSPLLVLPLILPIYHNFVTGGPPSRMLRLYY